MSRQAPIQKRREDDDDAQDFRDEIAVVNERDKIYPQQREAARPADEVMERLLRRHPAP